jgi:hypothetical protein
MDRVEIVAYRPCVKVDVKGPTLAHGYFASLSPQGGGNRHNERRSYGDNPLAYFKSKTVPTMGEAQISIYLVQDYHVYL